MKVSSPEKKAGRRGRKCVIIIPLLLVLAAAGAYVLINALVNTDRLRSEIAAHIEATVGVSVHLDAVSVSFLPVPGIVLHGMRMGEGDVYLDVDVCDVFIEPAPLMRRELRVTSAEIRAARLRLPRSASVAAEQLEAMMQRIRAHQQQRVAVDTYRYIDLEVDAVVVRELHVMLGDVAYASGEARFTHVTTPRINGMVTAHLYPWGVAAQLQAVMQFERRVGQPLALEGEAAVVMEETALPVRDTSPVLAAAQTHIAFSGDSLDAIAFEATGEALLTHEDTQLPATITAKAWWQQDAFIINDFHWQSPGIAWLADATIAVREADFAFHVHQAVMEAAPLQTVLNWLMPQGIRMAATPDAVLSITDLLAGINQTTPLRLASGAVELSGMRLMSPSDEPVLDNVQLTAAVTEGRLFVQEAAGNGWTASGWVTPNFAERHLEADITAAGRINAHLLEMVFPALAAPLTSISGQIQLDTFEGTYCLDKRTADVTNVTGTLQEAHIAGHMDDSGTPVAISDVKATFRYDDDAIYIDAAHFGGTALEGAVHLDASDSPRLELTGDASLADVSFMLPSMFPVRDIAGRLEITSLIMPVSEGGLSRMEFAGVLHNGSGNFDTPAWTDSISDVAGTLDVAHGEVRLLLSGQSTRVGGWQCDAVYAMDAARLAGEMRVDVGMAAGTFLSDSAWDVPAAGIVGAAYGKSGFAFMLQLPPAPDDKGVLEFRRQDTPLLYFQGVLKEDTTGALALQDRLLQSHLPLPLVLRHLNLHRGSSDMTPIAVETTGNVEVRYEQSAANAPFMLVLDASACTVEIAPWLNKARDVPLRLTIEGAAQQPHSMALLLDGQHIPVARAEGGNYGARDVSIDLNAVQRLLPPEIRPDGRLVVSFDTAPLHVQAQLRDVQITLLDDITFGVVNGTVAYTPDSLRMDNVSVQGHGFDCHVDGVQTAGVLDATVTGARVDMNRVMALSEALAEIRALESPAEKGMAMPELTGALTVQLGEVAYRRGVVRQVDAAVQLAPEIITLEPLSFRVGHGAVRGRARLQPEREGERRPVSIYVDLRADNVEKAYAEQVLFQEPRELTGLASGAVEAQWPTGRHGYRRMSGDLKLRLRDGSLGRLGFVTRLTTLLRTREIVQLRAPSLRDEGLTYETATVNVTMRDGRARLHDCTAESPSYSVVASGVVDFAQMQTDVQMAFNVLDGVTSLVERVPVIGPTATSVVRGATKIRLRATGSPFDIRWQPDVL